MSVSRERCAGGDRPHRSVVMSIARVHENATRYSCPLCGGERVVLD